ncbi:hypothetical protein FXW78_26045 [Rhodococcus opacus]|nr:hypothetical protein [Rhodococcus opacus]
MALHYRILNAAPDGDSVRFYPDDPQAFARAGLACGRTVSINEASLAVAVRSTSNGMKSRSRVPREVCDRELRCACMSFRSAVGASCAIMSRTPLAQRDLLARLLGRG